MIAQSDRKIRQSL